MKKFIKNIKEKLNKKPKFKKFFNVFTFVLTVNSYLLNIFFIICVIVGANLSEIDYKANIIYHKNDVVKKAVVDNRDGFSEDTTYYYFPNTCWNVAFLQGIYDYYNSQTGGDGNLNISSISCSTSNIKDSGSTFYSFTILRRANAEAYYFSMSSGSTRVTMGATSYNISMRIGDSTTTRPFGGAKVQKNSAFGAVLYNIYLNSVGGEYTETDLENAYNEGFADGVASHVSPVVDSELVIDPNYDFRKLISITVDKDYGFIQINSLSSATPLDMYQYCFSGGSSWNVGTKRYNAIVLSVLCLDDSQALSYNGSKTDYAYVSDIKGSSGVKIFGLARVDYIYLDVIDAESTWQKVGDGVNYLTEADYFVNIYTYETLLTGLNDNSKPSLLANFYNIKWNDNGFRVLTNFDSDNTIVTVPQFNTLTMNELLSLNDKYITNNDSTTANAFTLLSSAFRATANILNIQILPNITIGILLFIPLIVTIVLFIVKLLRK